MASGKNIKKAASKKELSLLLPKVDSIFELEPAVLRAYPKSPAALNVMHAHAKCSIAR
jgi:hypothetical protein